MAGTDLPGNREPGWYYRLSAFFRERFGRPVYKIPLDAGFTCPNRDGTVGTGGCIYCHNPSFSPGSSEREPVPVREQVRRAVQRKPERLYLAYFQSYTNTYAPVDQLRVRYDAALEDSAVVGLSVATRPDCVGGPVLDLLESYARTKHVWVEYGLQTAHDATLRRINRGHTFARFREAVEATRGRGIYVCAHVILGLPGESRSMMLQTVEALNSLSVDGIKFHHLQVIAGTPLEEQHRRGEVPVFDSPAAYIPLVCDCLERLSPHIAVHRLAARVTADSYLVAPRWQAPPAALAAAVERELKGRGTCQGSSSLRSKKKEI